jgi:predicted outer membrane protein
MNRSILIAAVFAVPFAAFAHDKDKAAYVDPDRATPQQIVFKLHHKNKMHAELGNLAQTQSSTHRIREFGEKLAKEQNHLDESVVAYAREKGYALSEVSTESDEASMRTGSNDALALRDDPAATDTAQIDERREMKERARAEMDRLKGLHGSEFDRAFLSNLNETSTRMIGFLEGAMAQQSDHKLKSLMEKSVHMLKSHQREAQKLLNGIANT